MLLLILRTADDPLARTTGATKLPGVPGVGGKRSPIRSDQRAASSETTPLNRESSNAGERLQPTRNLWAARLVQDRLGAGSGQVPQALPHLVRATRERCPPNEFWRNQSTLHRHR